MPTYLRLSLKLGTAPSGQCANVGLSAVNDTMWRAHQTAHCGSERNIVDIKWHVVGIKRHITAASSVELSVRRHISTVRGTSQFLSSV
jgi:hypothetical protein